MSRLTSSRDFRREISEIDAMLDLDRRLTEEHGPDPAAELMTAGLERRRRELVEEMEERGGCAPVEVQTRTVQSDGRLDEAGIHRGYFGFITEAGEVVTGHVEDHLLPELEKYFNKPCRALFTITERLDRATGGTTRSYRLDQLAPPGERLSPARVGG